MARIKNQTNPWGATGGYEVQRSDLWVGDFSEVTRGMSFVVRNNLQNTISGKSINATSVLSRIGNDLREYQTPDTYTVPEFSSFYIQSISLPDLKVEAEATMRDSRPYNMPGSDVPLGAISMTFILEAAIGGAYGDNFRRSEIYHMLDRWRSMVRAGRGGMSHELGYTLNADYNFDFAWDVSLMLLKGGQINQLIQSQQPVQSPLNGVQAAGQLPGTQRVNANAPVRATNDITYSSRYILKNMWLASFKMSELSYTDGAGYVTISTEFFAEDILNR